MNDEQFRKLMEQHRETQKTLTTIFWLVLPIFFFTVLAPILQQLGLWNLMDW